MDERRGRRRIDGTSQGEIDQAMMRFVCLSGRRLNDSSFDQVLVGAVIWAAAQLLGRGRRTQQHQ